MYRSVMVCGRELVAAESGGRTHTRRALVLLQKQDTGVVPTPSSQVLFIPLKTGVLFFRRLGGAIDTNDSSEIHTPRLRHKHKNHARTHTHCNRQSSGKEWRRKSFGERTGAQRYYLCIVILYSSVVSLSGNYGTDQ